MKARCRLFVLAVSLLLVHDTAHGRNWRVEKDGSGDYTSIQPALDATAPGDTVLIGPGRFLDTHEVDNISWTEDVYAAVWTDSISIIGSGSGITYIGPAQGTRQHEPRPKGIYAASDARGCRIESLSVTNVRDGIYWNGGVAISNCAITGGVSGIVLWPTSGAEVTNVVCAGCEGHGIIAFAPGVGMTVSDCQFDGIEGGVSVIGVDNVVVENCLFSNHIVGVQYDSTYGRIVGCVFDDIQNTAIVLRLSSTEVKDNIIKPSGITVALGTFSHMYGTGNIVMGGSYATIEVSGSTIDFHGNHIMNGGGMSIWLNAFLDDPPDIIDLSGNYWGTTESDSISTWIVDGHDNPNIHAFVEFEPFSPVPLSSEKKSMGDMKRMFR
jgi:hypothetical protein